MTDNRTTQATNVYHNIVTSATPNPLIQNPDSIDEEFANGANHALSLAVELIRTLIGAHQSAAAIIVGKDWPSIRKFFSLSEKYAAWADYHTPATGYGIHSWLLEYNRPARLTQAELEAHPEWKGFGTEAGKHPPMRGWLATPLVDSQGVNWGLLQLSDKHDGDFTANDEAKLVRFAELLSLTLETLWELRNERKRA